MTRPTCATCKAFDLRQGDDVGKCRRHAPTINDADLEAIFPWMDPNDDWCFEHVEKLDPDKLPDVMRG